MAAVTSRSGGPVLIIRLAPDEGSDPAVPPSYPAESHASEEIITALNGEFGIISSFGTTKVRCVPLACFVAFALRVHLIPLFTGENWTVHSHSAHTRAPIRSRFACHAVCMLCCGYCCDQVGLDNR